MKCHSTSRKGQGLQLRSQVTRIVRLIGVRPLMDLLNEFEHDWLTSKSKKRRLSLCKNLLIAHNDDIDGG